MKKIFLLFMLIFSLVLVGCNFKKVEVTEDFGLTAVTNASDLAKLLKASNSRYNNGAPIFGGTPGLESTADSSDSISYKSSDYTKTNVQVEGVDEGDVMKTDGSRIYTISWDRLQVIDLLGNGEMELLLSEKITSALSEENYHSYTYYSELYVTDDYLIVIGQKYGYSYFYLDDKENQGDVTTDYRPFYYHYTAMSIVDIYDIETLKKVDNYEVSGYLLGSRLIDKNLYLISNHYAYNYGEETDYDVRPWYRHNDDVSYFDYESIKYIPDTIYQSFTVISNVNLNKEKITVNNNVFLSSSSWGHIYVSTNAIYFAANYSWRTLFGSYQQNGMLVSYQFSKTSGQVSFGGYGTFDGYTLNQFSLDEYNGYMRLATTDGWGDSVKNRLYIFERVFEDDIYKLKKISLIDEGLGKPGERMQSVRFNKDVATIVTFLQTDPFYTVDLSDPYKPVIAGELEIPGFSTYQHPWKDNLIIGIGFSADNNGRIDGIKLSLYDITDIKNPLEVGKSLEIKNSQSSWTFSEATYNHKSIMIDKSRNSFGFAMNKYTWGETWRLVSDYVIFDVDETKEQPIQIKHSISHSKYFDIHKDLYGRYWYYYDFSIKRAFRVDDYVYVISDEVITSHNLLGDLSTVDEILFQTYYTTDK